MSEIDDRITHRCCESFAKACRNETDNEGWGSLVWVSGGDASAPAGALMIGSDLPPIRCCPWCGATIAGPLARAKP